MRISSKAAFVAAIVAFAIGLFALGQAPRAQSTPTTSPNPLNPAYCPIVETVTELQVMKINTEGSVAKAQVYVQHADLPAPATLSDGYTTFSSSGNGPNGEFTVRQ